MYYVLNEVDVLWTKWSWCTIKLNEVDVLCTKWSWCTMKLN